MSTIQQDAARIQQYRVRIQQQESSPRPYVLHYDVEIGDLRPWLWPINEAGERVTPSALPSFRAEGFRRPCCLCSVPGLDGVGMGYKESSVFMCIGRQHFGKYMVGCASRKCGYRVCIEWAYAMPGLPMQHFYRTEPASHPLAYKYPNRSQRLRRRAGKVEKRAPVAVESPFLKLIRLDSFTQPGLPEAEFYSLFTMCRQCRWVMTRSAFQHHRCAAPRAFIDLTSDNED